MVSIRSSTPAMSSVLLECPLKIDEDIPPKAKVHIEVTISLRKREGERKKELLKYSGFKRPTYLHVRFSAISYEATSLLELFP